MEVIMSGAYAIVIKDKNGNLFVLPSEYIDATKVDPASHDEVANQLSGAANTVEIGEMYSFIGEISLPDGGVFARDADDVAWPHFLPPGK